MRTYFIIFAVYFIFGIGFAHGQARVVPSFLPKVTGSPQLNSLFQSDGKVVIWGELQTVDNSAVERIARLNADGSLDKTFHPPAIPDDIIITSVVVDSKGKIMIGGRAETKPYCVRLNTDGTVDNTFMLDPIVSREIYQITVLPNDSYLILKVAYAPERYFVKLNNNGSVDSSFVCDNPLNFQMAKCTTAVQADGKIIIGGEFTQFGSRPANCIVRLKANGDIDDTFSSGGPKNSNGNPSVSSITVSGSRIIVTGSFNSFNAKIAANVVALQSDGSLDATFLSPGLTVNYFSHAISKSAFVSDGILLAGINSEGGGYVYHVLKLKLDGSLDTSFAIATLQVPQFGYAIQPSLSVSASAIMLSGFLNSAGSASRNGIAQLGLDGSVKGFNPIIGGRGDIFDAQVQNDGKIIIGGEFSRVNGVAVSNFARLNADGTLDASFQNKLGLGFDDGVHAVAVQADGKILVGGVYTHFNGLSKSVLVRLNADGTLDTGFDTNLFPGSTREGGAKVIRILSTGELMVGGDFVSQTTGLKSLLKLKSDGSEVTSFQLHLSSQIITAIEAQSDGNLLVGGEDFPNGYLRRIKPDGTVLNDFNSVNLSNYLVSDIAVLPSDKFVVAGFYSNGLHPVLQFTSTGSLYDNFSIAVNDGVLMGLDLEDDYLLLSGFFKTVNGVAAPGLAKVRLNGELDPTFNLPVTGFTRKLIRKNGPYREFYAIGSFRAIDSVRAFNIIDIADQFPADIQVSVSSLTQTYDKTEKTLDITTLPAGANYTLTFFQDSVPVSKPIYAGIYQAVIKIDDIHYFGSDTVTLTINKAVAHVQAKASSLTQTYNGSLKAVEATTTPSGLNVLVTYFRNGSLADPIGAGVYDVTMNIDNVNYLGTGNASLTINKASQTITFTQPGEKTLGDSPFSLQATATSGLPVQFEATKDLAAISASEVTLVKAGRMSIKAVQPGNENYQQADPIEKSFCIRPPKPQVTSSPTDQGELILASSNAVGNQWFFGNVKVPTGTGAELSVNEVGMYNVVTQVDDCVSEFSDAFSVVITGDLAPLLDVPTAYPNPTEDYLNVTVGSGDATGRIYDARGMDLGLPYSNRGKTLIFDVRFMLPGIFLVKIVDGESRHTVKFLRK